MYAKVRFFSLFPAPALYISRVSLPEKATQPPAPTRLDPLDFILEKVCSQTAS